LRPLLQRLPDVWDPKRMDALLLLHAIDKVIGRALGECGDIVGIVHGGDWFHFDMPRTPPPPNPTMGTYI
jgi:hypothetical protein